MAICGIYKITEKSTGKSYIGQSVDIARRFYEHQTSTLDWHKLIQENPTNWDYSIIEQCEENELNAREKYWIEYYDSCKNGFNKTLGNHQEFLDLKLPKSFYNAVIEAINGDLWCDIHTFSRIKNIEIIDNKEDSYILKVVFLCNYPYDDIEIEEDTEWIFHVLLNMNNKKSVNYEIQEQIDQLTQGWYHYIYKIGNHYTRTYIHS